MSTSITAPLTGTQKLLAADADGMAHVLPANVLTVLGALGGVIGVYKLTAQTLSNGATATLDFDTEIYDPASNFAASADGEITVTAAGTYLVLALVNHQSTASVTHAPIRLQLQSDESGSFADITDALIYSYSPGINTASETGGTAIILHPVTLSAGKKLRIRGTITSGYANAAVKTGSRVLLLKVA